MNTLLRFNLLRADVDVKRLGWVLVHSRWQFVAPLARATVRTMRRRLSALQYPYATFEAEGRCHLVFDDFGCGLYYTRSDDMQTWSPLQKLGMAEQNSSISKPQMLLVDDRVALLHEKNSGVWLQRGTITASGLQLGQATQITNHLMPLNGSRLLRAGDRVLISAGITPCVSNLLSAPITELLKDSL